MSNKPDPRLLLDVSRIGYSPEGAFEWRLGRRRIATRWDYMFGDEAPEPSFLDLSRPAVRERDRMPESLDVLPWAVLALTTRFGWAPGASLSCPVYDNRRGCVVSVLGSDGLVAGSLVERDPPEWQTSVCRRLVVEPFPVLDGLAAHDVPRAVLVAALSMPWKAA